MKLGLIASSAILTLTLSGCTGTPTDPIKKSWTEGSCSQSQPGVTLSIDFKGEITTHCALNFDGNGWQLFEAAGFTVQGTAKYPTAFACKINEQPSTFKCDESDPQDVYWGYFNVSDGMWTYATTGASDHQSKCGTWEGWVFMESASTEVKLPKPAEFTCN